MDIDIIPVKTKTGTPITLAEAKKQCQVEPEFTADDAYINSLVEIAIDKVEADTNSDVLETTNTLQFIPTPSPMLHAGDLCYVNQSPLKEFLQIQYKETLENGTIAWYTAPATSWRVRPWFSKFLITILEDIPGEEYRFIFTTGYAAAEIPRVLKGAALLKVSDLFDSERQGYTLNVQANRAYESLISKHVRTYWG